MIYWLILESVTLESVLRYLLLCFFLNIRGSFLILRTLEQVYVNILITFVQLLLRSANPSEYMI